MSPPRPLPPTERPLNFCEQGGVVADASQAIPDDPCEFWMRMHIVGIPCSNLTCLRCKARVRWADNLWPSERKSARLDAALLYDTPDWSQSPQLVVARGPRKGARLYACRCDAMVMIDSCTMAYFDEMDKPAPDWECAGHPVAELPILVRGVPITADTDLRDLILRSLRGELPPNPSEDEMRIKELFLFRLFVRLQQTPYADQVSRIAAELGGHPDAVIRVRVTYLFRRFQRIAGWEELVRIVRDHPELYGEEQAPGLYKGTTMRSIIEDTLKGFDPEPTEILDAPTP